MVGTATQRDMDEILGRLKGMIGDHEDSLRTLTSRTKGRELPEKLHHSTLSHILNGKPRKNLYLQQFLVVLELLGTDINKFVVGDEEAALAEAWKLLPENRRQVIRGEIFKGLGSGENEVRVRRKFSKFI